MRPEDTTEEAWAALRERYPEADEREIWLRAVRQQLGKKLFEKVYGPCLDGA